MHRWIGFVNRIVFYLCFGPVPLFLLSYSLMFFCRGSSLDLPTNVDLFIPLPFFLHMTCKATKGIPQKFSAATGVC